MATPANIAIIGGGIMGLAIALELQQRGMAVTVLTRNVEEAAGRAAAGMLAPQAERLDDPALFDLCLASRDRYADWVSKLEHLTGVEVGYWPSGILAPRYTLPDRAEQERIHQQSRHSPAYWLDAQAIRTHQPDLSAEVVGGWWFPEDAQVDNRRLYTALQTAAATLGVEVRSGVTVQGIHQRQGRVVGLQTTAGDLQADHYILATGAWAADLLPLAIAPCKGQMLRVQAPAARLRQVLFGDTIYIVPRRDGQIIIGATVEQVGFTAGTTPQGLHHLLTEAMRLYPPLATYPIAEQWWGYRPMTPDFRPILGSSHCDNLTLATGHHRNGILLAPITASLIADVVEGKGDRQTLDPFAWSRFQPQPPTSPSVSVTSPPTALQLSSAVPAIEPMQAFQLSDPAPTQPATAGDRAEAAPAIDLLSQLDQPLVIAGRSFASRLMTGTGKYRTMDEMQRSIAASQGDIVTVAVRRVQTNAPGHEGLAEAIDWTRIWMLPNTAGCKTAEEAVRVARLGREMAKLLGQEDNNFVKLEVIPDAKYLLPDPIGTLEAAEQLVKEGFAVLPYINADPLLAKRLEEVGCATVMPLGSPIGSGQGIRNTANIQIIIENAKIPVVVDAGIGTPSEAAQAMEMGADALLINTAIAQATNPPAMAMAMGMATAAGRLAYLAGRIPVKTYAAASSPLTGTVTGG